LSCFSDSPADFSIFAATGIEGFLFHLGLCLGGQGDPPKLGMYFHDGRLSSPATSPRFGCSSATANGRICQYPSIGCSHARGEPTVRKGQGRNEIWPMEESLQPVRGEILDRRECARLCSQLPFFALSWTASSRSIAAMTLSSSGLTLGWNRATTLPDRLIRNFSKFQRIGPA
jgi:hypothetical protein